MGIRCRMHMQQSDCNWVLFVLFTDFHLKCTALEYIQRQRKIYAFILELLEMSYTQHLSHIRMISNRLLCVCFSCYVCMCMCCQQMYIDYFMLSGWLFKLLQFRGSFLNKFIHRFWKQYTKKKNTNKNAKTYTFKSKLAN